MPTEKQMEQVSEHCLGLHTAAMWQWGRTFTGLASQQAYCWLQGRPKCQLVCTHPRARSPMRACMPHWKAACSPCPIPSPLAYCPSPQELKASGFTQQQLDASRAATAAQLQQLKAAAEEGKRRQH